MYLALSDEQQFLQEAALDALGRQNTLEAAREALDGAPRAALWELGVDAGWSGLLSGEDADGAGLGIYEALLVLEACGRRLADAGLLGHLAATALLEAAETDLALRSACASGERRAALIDPSLADRGGHLDAVVDGSEVVLTGAVRNVLDADGADVLLVVGQDADGDLVLGAVEPGADGLEIEAGRAYDGTRSLAHVRLDAVRGSRLEVPDVGLGRDVQRALLAAEAVGAADACLTMSRDYAIDRIAFGRAIGSYQAIKHKLVEMLRRVEGGRSLLVASGRAWEAGEGFALAANAARTVAGDALDYAAPENIFIHGGVGATWEHDASLYYRRAELTRKLAGGAEAAAEAVTVALLAEATVPTDRAVTA